jgi:uncharacterized protein
VEKLTQNLPASPDVSLVRTVVLQPTPFCNINCRYCYLPQRSNTTVMPLATIIAAFEKIWASGWASPQMTIIWHAGEPLVLPVSYYETAFKAIEAIRPPTIQLRHSIQTNGMLLTPEWCDLIRKWQIGLGVSIDGPRHLHDANRVTRSGSGTFDRAIAGIRLLRKEEIPFHTISVLSEAALNSPQELLDFYISEGIEDVCFNVEESEGDHISTLLATNNPRERFRHFLDRFWILSRETSKIHFIREIDGMITRIFRPEGVPLNNEQVEPFGMLNIDCHGNVCSFSPELLGYKHPAYNNFIIGNVLSNSLEEMRQSAAMQAMTRDIAAGVEKCRKECEYFSVCGGGAPVNKLSENGTFASSKTSFCSLVYMAPTDLILSALDRLEHDFESPAAQKLHFLGPAPLAPPSSHMDAPLVACTDANSFLSDRPDLELEIQRGTR